MAGGKFSARKASIINRGPESGGSVGGNDKAGLVSLWAFSRIPRGIMINRLPGDCCTKRAESTNPADPTNPTNPTDPTNPTGPTNPPNHGNGGSIPF